MVGTCCIKCVESLIQGHSLETPVIDRIYAVTLENDMQSAESFVQCGKNLLSLKVDLLKARV